MRLKGNPQASPVLFFSYFWRCSWVQATLISVIFRQPLATLPCESRAWAQVLSSKQGGPDGEKHSPAYSAWTEAVNVHWFCSRGLMAAVSLCHPGHQTAMGWSWVWATPAVGKAEGGPEGALAWRWKQDHHPEQCPITPKQMQAKMLTIPWDRPLENILCDCFSLALVKSMQRGLHISAGRQKVLYRDAPELLLPPLSFTKPSKMFPGWYFCDQTKVRVPAMINQAWFGGRFSWQSHLTRAAVHRPWTSSLLVSLSGWAWSSDIC